MNTRERFLAVMHFEPCDRTLLWEMGYWRGTLDRWYSEGLPKKTGLDKQVPWGELVFGPGLPWQPDTTWPLDRDVAETFGFDLGMQRVPVRYWLYPEFEERVLEDHGDTQVIVDANGVTKLVRQDAGSKPTYLAWPVSDHDDLERLFAERLQPHPRQRLPDNWADLVRQYRDRDFPLAIHGYPCGYFGTPRELLGVENLLVAYYEKPELIKDLCQRLTDFWITLYDPILDQVHPDLALFWEDMCYKSGSFISPIMFREFLMPYYKQITSFFRDHGIDIILVDTDGNCNELIPLFLESGVTGLYPFEVRAGMDIVQVRTSHPRVQILGGLDKTRIAAGRAAIDEELEHKLPFMLQHGGYVPYTDHLVPPDVRWEDYIYFRKRIHEMVARNGF